MNPLFHTDFSISDSLRNVRKSVLIYETIIIRALKEANILFDKITNKQVFIKMILSGTLQKETEIPIMHYHTCKLLADMGYYKEIYEYVKARDGQYFNSLTEEIEKII